MAAELEPVRADPGPAIDRWTEDQIAMATRSFAVDCTLDELAVFAEISQRKHLDPWLGQIVAIKRAGKMIVQETVEGLRAIAERSGLYGGYRGPQWTGDGYRWFDVWLETDNPPAAARFWVIRKDWTEPAPGTARWASNAQYFKDRQGQPQLVPIWKDRPDEMLAKCAEVRALKRAFTKEFAAAGISVRDLSDAQIVTVEAKRAGLDDDDRHALVAEVTAGRTESTTELTDDETLAVRQEIAKRAPGPLKNLSPSCGAGQHGQCPGYYKMAHTCECDCHTAKGKAQQQPDAVVRTIARAAGDLEDRLELLTPWQIEELKTWRRAMGLARPVSTLDAAERTRLAAELDRRGWGQPDDTPPPHDIPPPPEPGEPDPGEEPF